ncbi:MAG: phage holin family protein [Parcubacteria group bacterium]
MYVIRILLANIVAVWVADYFIDGFWVSGDLKELLIAGIILGLIFLIIKPLLKLVSLPLIWITAGLFTLVIYGFLIWVVAYFMSSMSVALYMPLIWATLIIAIINYIARGFKL